MREGIGATWLFQIVIVFVLLFSGYLAVSMNMSKAFKVKDEVINIIQRRGGIDTVAVEEIEAYLSKVGYSTIGNCPQNDGWRGLSKNPKLGFYPEATRSNLCVKPVDLPERYESYPGELPYSAYFRIKVFFHMDLPIFGSLFNMDIVGDTTRIYYPKGID